MAVVLANLSCITVIGSEEREQKQAVGSTPGIIRRISVAPRGPDEVRRPAVLHRLMSPAQRHLPYTRGQGNKEGSLV
jgi:hypothetical protein